VASGFLVCFTLQLICSDCCEGLFKPGCRIMVSRNYILVLSLEHWGSVYLIISKASNKWDESNLLCTCEFWGSYSGEDVSVVPQSSEAVCNSRWIPPFRRVILHPSSTHKMEAVCFSETLVSTYESTWHHNPEEQHWYYILLSQYCIE
jgi:hypothetical protein